MHWRIKVSGKKKNISFIVEYSAKVKNTEVYHIIGNALDDRAVGLDR